MSIQYGDDIQVWTFTGWEDFDWDAFECPEDACDFLEGLKTRIRSKKAIVGVDYELHNP